VEAVEEYEAVVSSSYGWKFHRFRWDPTSGLSVSRCGAWRFPERRAGLRPEILERENAGLIERCRRCFRQDHPRAGGGDGPGAGGFSKPSSTRTSAPAPGCREEEEKDG
jgi:hypothetical protein